MKGIECLPTPPPTPLWKVTTSREESTTLGFTGDPTGIFSIFLGIVTLCARKSLSTEAHKSLPKDSPQLAATLAQFGMSLLQLKVYTGAEPILRASLTIREKKEPDDWRTFNTRSMLGGVLLGQKKYADAEPLLSTGYEGMKAREKNPGNDVARLAMKIRIPEAVDRLIALYAALEQPDGVKKRTVVKAELPKTESPKPAEKK